MLMDRSLKSEEMARDSKMYCHLCQIWLKSFSQQDRNNICTGIQLSKLRRLFLCSPSAFGYSLLKTAKNCRTEAPYLEQTRNGGTIYKSRFEHCQINGKFQSMSIEPSLWFFRGNVEENSRKVQHQCQVYFSNGQFDSIIGNL